MLFTIQYFLLARIKKIMSHKCNHLVKVDESSLEYKEADLSSVVYSADHVKYALAVLVSFKSACDRAWLLVPGGALRGNKNL
jgi:hypothetical protein